MATNYEPTIGLEVHAQLLTKTKLFCPAPANFGTEPNVNISPVCLGLPGALPVPNAAAVKMAVQAALALGCTVQLKSRFDRKHYFYPDLPKGYQISQYEFPYATSGKVSIELDGKTKDIGLERIHMEEDAAKNIHASNTQSTLVDYNRAGVPLVEIVSKPEIQSAEEAEAYLRKLREVLLFVGVNDGNLEEGSFRCDANVSIKPVGDKELGTRVELKNINSFRFVRKALEYEIARQEALVSGGGKVEMETRTRSDGQGKTLPMRSKEQAHDYRYFPDPDLPALVLSQQYVEDIKSTLPELASAKRIRWQQEWGITAYDAAVLTSHPAIANYFETTSKIVANQSEGKATAVGKKVANFVQGEVLRHTRTSGLHADFPLSPEQLAELLIMLFDEAINGKTAKDVLAEVIATGKGAAAIVKDKGLAQVTDTAAIEEQVRAVLKAHPGEVAKYREGKTNLMGFFVGKVMQASQGKANPKAVNETIQKLLNEV